MAKKREKKKIQFANSCCSYYNDLNGYFCRKCGASVQYEDKSRQKILHGWVTDEKFCDQCGKKRHDRQNCSPKKDVKF